MKAPIKVFGIEGRYAHALFSAASKNKAIDKVEKELNGFQGILNERKDFADFMRNPTLSKRQKQTAIKGVCEDLKFSELTVNLFGSLAENNRLPRAQGVVRAYQTLMQAHRGEVSCTVTTAQPLDSKMRAEVEKVLASFVDKTQVLKLEMKLEPSLLGGMVVEVGDKYIDMSTQSKVKRIMQVLREAV